MEIRISDRLIDALLGLFVFAFVFNVAYSMQREMAQAAMLPVWLMLIDLCLVAKLMRNQKLLALALLTLVSLWLEYMRLPRNFDYGNTFEVMKHVFLTLVIYIPPLLFFCTGLFVALDRIGAERDRLNEELAGSHQEEQKMSMGPSREVREANQLKVESNYDLFQRALTEIVMLRTPKDIPGFLFRNFSRGYGMERGLVVEVNHGSPKVVEAWGLAAGKDPGAVQIPSELIHMLESKGGAILDRELQAPGANHTIIETLAEEAFDPVGLFPVFNQGKLRFVVVAGTGGGVGQNLKLMPAITVSDLSGQFLDRYLNG